MRPHKLVSDAELRYALAHHCAQCQSLLSGGSVAIASVPVKIVYCASCQEAYGYSADDLAKARQIADGLVALGVNATACDVLETGGPLGPFA